MKDTSNNTFSQMRIDFSNACHDDRSHALAMGLILLLVTIMVLQPLKACKLWAVCTRSEITLPTLTVEGRSVLDGQLTSFYHQSQSMLDGWALLSYSDNYQGNIVPLCRSADPATNDSSLYWETVETLLDEDLGRIGIGHLRVATSGLSSIPNPHPWMFHDNGMSFSLIHNGTVNKDLLHDLLTNHGSDLSWLELHPPQTFGGGDWKSMGWGNVVDSELILLFIMKRINDVQDTIEGFKQAMSDLVNAGISAGQLNLIFSNGASLMVFGGENGLFINEYPEYYSVMTQPPSTDGSQWQGIDHQELVIIGSDSLTRYPDFITNNLDDETVVVPSYFMMFPAYPNPFNGAITFMLDGLVSSDIDVSIYSVTGENVDQFDVPGPMNGKIRVKWQPPVNLASGTYFIRASTRKIEETQKILFIK